MNPPRMRYLVTGATGFVGRHLLKEMVKNSQARPFALARSLDSWEAQDWTWRLGSVELVEGSVLQPGKWMSDPRLEGLQGIFHLAAVIRHSRKDPEEMVRTNVEGLLNMIRLGAKYRCRVVFVSTSGTVGCFRSPEEWADEESPYCESVVGSWPYYHSKIQAEKEARELATTLGVELVILRPPMLLGPGDHRYRATSLILRVLSGKLPFVVRGGMHFVDIRDAVRAFLQAMVIPNPRPVYHLPGTQCTIDEFFGMIAEISGVPAPKLHVPAVVAQTFAAWGNRIGDLLSLKNPLLPDRVVFEMGSHYWGTRSRYAQELGFVARSGRMTLKDTIDWIKANHKGLSQLTQNNSGVRRAA